jgi:hypothetical protein
VRLPVRENGAHYNRWPGDPGLKSGRKLISSRASNGACRSDTTGAALRVLNTHFYSRIYYHNVLVQAEVTCFPRFVTTVIILSCIFYFIHLFLCFIYILYSISNPSLEVV